MEVKRYESDRDFKDKVELEKQKLSSMSWRKRIEYIWAYYKWHMLLVLVVCYVIYNIGLMIYDTQYDDVFSAIIVNGAADGDPIAEDFKNYCEDTEKFHRYNVNAGMYLTGKQNDYKSDQDTLGIMLGMIAGKDVDVLILPKFQMENYAKQDVYYKMTEILTPEQIEQYGDAVGEYSLQVPNNKTLQKHGCVPGEDAYLGVLRYVEDLTYVQEFIRYLMGE